MLRQTLNKKGNMNAEKINELLKEKGVTQADVADNLTPPVRQSAVNQVIHKKQTSRRIQDAICEVIEKPFEEVWVN